MPSGLHFPFRFDRELLRSDLTIARTVQWQPHYNEKDYGGNWNGIALRSATGDNNQLVAGAAADATFHDTPLLDCCPYFRQVLSVFECPLKSVRLLSLAPQSFIREHSDHALGYDDGEIRIHVPIQTNPDVEFYVAGERLLLEEGHCYFVNVNLPHRVNNRGASERIHLVIDAEVNEWVHALFRRGMAEHWDVPRSALPPRNVDDFRRYVLTQPALQQQLQAIEKRSQFEERVKELGQQLGFGFHEGDIDAALRCGPLAASAPIPPPAGDWTPVRVFFRDRQPIAEWTYTGTGRFTEPFFEQSVKVALRRPFAQLFRIELPLSAASQIEPEQMIEPSGFIFHMSRCGSTLISQMLAASANHLMLSEPPPIDDVIQANRLVEGLAREDQIEWLRWIVRALGRRCGGGQTHYFVKLDAWHIHSFSLIREAFPNTPWIFVYRDPLEVMVSQLSKPGRLSIPGAVAPEIFRLSPEDVTGLSREDWCARVLAGILKAAVEAGGSDPPGLFVDYRDLPDAMSDSIAAHFRLSLSHEDVARMREATAFDAKTPALFFEPDSETKQAAATTLVRELCAAHLNELYRELKSKNRAVSDSPAVIKWLRD